MTNGSSHLLGQGEAEHPRGEDLFQALLGTRKDKTEKTLCTVEVWAKKRPFLEKVEKSKHEEFISQLLSSFNPAAIIAIAQSLHPPPPPPVPSLSTFRSYLPPSLPLLVFQPEIASAPMRTFSPLFQFPNGVRREETSSPPSPPPLPQRPQ